MVLASSASTVSAVLGPTNTGKTHLAIERMLGHRSGVIGFPLRLLARENYDRIAKAKGLRSVALVTGEEKIVPPEARYFVCTVESMPLDRDFDFLAVDEVQLAGDPERGHVFTDRLMHARGLEETMFLGADTIRPLLKRLVPETKFESRARLSRLEYSGACKVTRLPRRSAVVAFSASEVYALAELVRRQRGGAAVVMGALSPRTRNAQVAMYQEGDVDYLIATDAIGMGLNMDIDHVFFAADRKFDGRFPRKLFAHELAQIAGRAGRHMNDGTFGVTNGCAPLDEEIVAAIESHSFDPLKQLGWRSTRLDFATVRDLKRSLDAWPTHDFLSRKRDGEDQEALEALSRMPDILQRAVAPARIRLLWDVCQIPDFQKHLTESHARLLSQIYLYLTDSAETLPVDWVDTQMSRFDRTEGDIDTLMGRIAHIRTWTYITHRNDWIADAGHWQSRVRAIEDRLSDALHQQLTLRFVDRRSATLSRKLKGEKEDILAGVSGDGTVTVEGHHVGRLEGFTFIPDASNSEEAKQVLTAARRVLPDEIARRVGRLESDLDEVFRLDAAATFSWRGFAIADLAPGDVAWRPEIRVRDNEMLLPALRDRIAKRLRTWLADHLEAGIPNLLQLDRSDLSGAARGIAFQVLEGLGSAPAEALRGMVKDLDEQGRRDLARVGIRLGTENLYVPQLLKPKAVALRAVLWSVANGVFPEEGPPPEGRVQVVRESATPAAFDGALGYQRLGGRAIRIDMVERIAALVRQAARGGAFAISPDMLSLAGVDHDTFAAILGDLGYRKVGERPAEPPPPAPSATIPGGEEAADTAPAAQEPEPANDPGAAEAQADGGSAPEAAPADDPTATVAVEDAPESEALIQAPPSEETVPDVEPSAQVAAEDAPAEEAPAEEPQAEDAPAEDAPAEDAPAEDALAEDAPAEEAPAEQASAEEAPAEETVSEDAAPVVMVPIFARRKRDDARRPRPNRNRRPRRSQEGDGQAATTGQPAADGKPDGDGERRAKGRKGRRPQNAGTSDGGQKDDRGQDRRGKGGGKGGGKRSGGDRQSRDDRPRVHRAGLERKGEADPDSPFAALAQLRDALRSKNG